jgi:hypothetical protein
LRANKSDGGEPFAAVPAAISQNGLAALAGITVQEAMLAFPSHFRRLILSLHKVKNV